MQPQAQKATQQQTKTYNSQLVLKTIYDRGQISRAEVARLTDLTRTSVSDIVTELQDKGLVEEVGAGAHHAQRGQQRPPCHRRRYGRRRFLRRAGRSAPSSAAHHRSARQQSRGR